MILYTKLFHMYYVNKTDEKYIQCIKNMYLVWWIGWANRSYPYVNVITYNNNNLQIYVKFGLNQFCSERMLYVYIFKFLFWG